MTTPLIDIQNLSKEFISGTSVQKVLKRIDLSINTGELAMIVGPSGCGKTTLLNIMAGLLSFEDGDVKVCQVALKELNAQEKADFRRQNIGFVFQSYYLITSITVQENVSIPLLLNKVPQQKIHELTTRILEEVGLKDKINAYPNQLSGGQQQRVAIARALVADPQLLICDEPTAALDSESGQKVMELLTEIAKKSNRCIVIVTHDNRIFKFATQMIKMEDGIIIP